MFIPIMIAVILSLGIGTGAGYYIRKKVARVKVNSVEDKVEKLLEEAKIKEKELIHKAKDRAYNILEKAKQEEESRRKELHHLQQRLEKRESIYDKKILELENKYQQLGDKAQKVEEIKKEINQIKKDQLKKLEHISRLSVENAKNVLLNKVEQKIKEDLVHRIKKIQNESSEEIQNEAKRVLSSVMVRCAASHAAESCTTIVELPSDEMKGRIIGREGRNIKTIEQLLGVEIIIDDTPEVITISGFNPIRRHVAKKALERLILDGRIHPGRIEDSIEKAKKEISQDIKKAGEQAVYDVGVAGLDPKLVQIIGRLKYRTSYGQNVLLHSIEVAHLSAMLASELGADKNIARKGGLLHDIGKALDHEISGSHADIGKDIATKFNLPEPILKCIQEHHDDMPTTPEGVIVKIADAISASRPGARNASHEIYLQRLTELEDLATQFDGVDKAYAIQAGREIRVFVNPDTIDDLKAIKMAQEIANKIEKELKYPGEIKVNIIREKRIIEYAK